MRTYILIHHRDKTRSSEDVTSYTKEERVTRLKSLNNLDHVLYAEIIER